MDEATNIGPIANSENLESLIEIVEDAVGLGG